MAHTYDIVPATPLHLSMAASRMREGDRSEFEAVGNVPRHRLYTLWRASFMSRAGFIDGQIAAVWGCAGTLASRDGAMWLVTTPQIELMPVAFAKVARANIREMLDIKHSLVSACIDGYEQSLRLWRMLGFEIGEPVEIPPHGAKFRRLFMERQ